MKNATLSKQSWLKMTSSHIRPPSYASTHISLQADSPRFPVTGQIMLTLLQFTHCHHAVVRQLPDAQRPVVAHGGTQREQRVGGQAPHLPFHVTLGRQSHDQRIKD